MAWLEYQRRFLAKKTALHNLSAPQQQGICSSAQKPALTRRIPTLNEPATILDMLGHPTIGGPTQPRTLAVIGLSDNPARPSHSVSAYMQQHGYRILPINPAIPEGSTLLGEPVFPSLAALSVQPDVVNVFRLPRFVPTIVNEMIALGLKNLWVQLGIVNPEAAARAEQAGIRVIMDRCILIEHAHLTR
jgi:uncharacterized protein